MPEPITTTATIAAIVLFAIDKIFSLCKKIKKCNINFGACCKTEVETEPEGETEAHTIPIP
jgi:hypothetical protein